MHIERDFFVSLEPIEALLLKVDYPCIIASGNLDKNPTPTDMKYFQQLANQNVSFRRLVRGAAHSVADNDGPVVVAQYLKALFAE
ncbi:MAG TPA: hypothetical protein VF644_02415 [Pyrinomonadaceae bacterium]